MTNPSRSRSNGRLARDGSSLRVDIAVSRTNPVTPSGWIMLWTPPASMTSASPSRISSAASPIAWALAAHSRQARRVRAARAEGRGDVPGRRPRLLLRLLERVQHPHPLAQEPPGVHLPPGAGATVHQADEPAEVLLPLARTEVHAEPARVQPLRFQEARLVDRLPGRRQRDPCVAAVTRPSRRVRSKVAREVEALQLRRDPRGEAAGIEQRDWADPAAPLAQGRPARLHPEPQRGDHPHARDDHPPLISSHESPPFSSPCHGPNARTGTPGPAASSTASGLYDDRHPSQVTVPGGVSGSRSGIGLRGKVPGTRFGSI